MSEDEYSLVAVRQTMQKKRIQTLETKQINGSGAQPCLDKAGEMRRPGSLIAGWIVGSCRGVRVVGECTL